MGELGLIGQRVSIPFNKSKIVTLKILVYRYLDGRTFGIVIGYHLNGDKCAIFAICQSGRARDGRRGWNKWNGWSQGKFEAQTWEDSLIFKDFVCAQNKLEKKKLYPVVNFGVKLLNSFLGFLPWTRHTLKQFIVM